MKPEKRIEQAQELGLRVEKMMDLLSIYACSHDLNQFPAELEEFLDDNYDVNNLDPGVELLMHAMAPNDGEDAELLDLQDLDISLASMVLVQFATPSRKYYDEKSWSCSWGMYYTHWVAAPTFEKAWQLGVAWAKSRHAANLAELSEA